MLFLIVISLLVAMLLYFVLSPKQDELSEKTSILAAKKDELDAASKQWKSRVDKSDAADFSVAGRMPQNKDVQISIPVAKKTKRSPVPKRFKGKGGQYVATIFKKSRKRSSRQNLFLSCLICFCIKPISCSWHFLFRDHISGLFLKTTNPKYVQTLFLFN